VTGGLGAALERGTGTGEHAGVQRSAFSVRGERQAESGKRRAESGKRQAASGKRQAASGKRPADTRHRPIFRHSLRMPDQLVEAGAEML